MKTINLSRINKPRFLCAIAFAVFVLLSFFQAVPFAATAEAYATVEIHVFDPYDNYKPVIGGKTEDLYMWAWSVGAGKMVRDSGAVSDVYYKEDNKAHIYIVELSEREYTALSGSTRLGILVVPGKRSEIEPEWSNQETQDVKVTLTFDENRKATVYYVRKDTDAYTSLEEGLMALEQISNARFTDTKTVKFATSSTIDKNAKATLYIEELSSNLVFTKTKLFSVTPTLDSGGKGGTAVFPSLNFDITKPYSLEITNYPKTRAISKGLLFNDLDVIGQYETYINDDDILGPVCTDEKTVFRLWAPLASAVRIAFYADGTSDTPAYAQGVVRHFLSKMGSDKPNFNDSKWNGVWEIEIKGDLHGLYYIYEISNQGVWNEAVDPYAKAAGLNGLRGMVVNLNRTNPEGWENDKHIGILNPQAYDYPIIWELHVRDFSVSPDSGMTYKGKYLAFTEQNTHVPYDQTLKTGIAYLKDLGITYVHLNPVYDFSSVDEGGIAQASNTNVFNWGYDPLNYNVPEGSYSTDPTRGEVRIKEFKQMVQALHDAGIGVIMDVVYNHTATIAGNPFHETTPQYYYRQQENGSGEYSDGSGCGNEVATEREMVRKFISDSVYYWATEYHIDGFRFDLMAIHDVDSMNGIRRRLDGITENGVNVGKKILMYGEPWTGEFVWPYKTNDRMRPSELNKGNCGVDNYAINLDSRVAIFSDDFREGIRGKNDPTNGIINGQIDSDKWNRIRRGLEGGAGADSVNSGWGTRTKDGTQQVSYASCHDNFIFWDQIVISMQGHSSDLVYDYPNPNYISRNKLGVSMYMTSTGMVLMCAGEEMGRTKYGNHNSYNSPDKINQIQWGRQKTFKDLYNYYKGMIALRKSYTTFKYGNTNPYGYFGNQTTDTLVFGRKDGNQQLIMIYNPSDYEQTVNASLNGYAQSSLIVISRNGQINLNAQGKLQSLGTTSASNIKVAPNSCLILTNKI